MKRHPSGLVWHDAEGYGVVESLYGETYWNNYVQRAQTLMGEKLNAARVALTRKHCDDGIVVDIGIGCGHFVEGREKDTGNRGITYGFDVNPVGIQWLKDRRAWWDPYKVPVPNATCWDSLEHMSFPGEFLERVRRALIVSIPIFTSMDHCLASKHFKPPEHLWYFTEAGLIRWADEHGFVCIENNMMETELGREDIGTFVFKREKV